MPHCSKLIALFLAAFCAVCIHASKLSAQDFAKYSPGAISTEEALKEGTLEKVRARIEYFYNRVTYPDGKIPVGARAKAYREAQEHMNLYGSKKGSSVQNASTWKNMGPFNIGGRIVALAVNPKNPKTIFIGAADGGIWRTFDEGKTWRSVSDDIPAQAMGAIIIDPVDTNIVYAGTGEANFGLNMFDGGGMYKSMDGGTTWQEIGAATLPPYSRASDMAINPQNTSIVYAAIPDGVRDQNLTGIYRTTDGGAHWDLILPGKMTDVVINPQRPEILYTVSSKVSGGATAARYGMYKTTDAGDTWFQLDVGVVDSLMGRTSIVICPGNPDVLYIGVSELTGGERTRLIGIFKTTDGGTSWQKLTVPFDYMVSQGWFDNVLGVHPANPDIVYAGGVKLIRSSDGGKTWTRIPDQGFGGILHVDQHAIEFNPMNPDRVYIGNDGGFFIGSQDGTVWEKSDLGLSITQFIGGAMHPASDEFLHGGTQDNGTMLTASAPIWDLVLYGDGGNGAINPLTPNVIYTTQENLKFWRSDDFGRTWTQAMGNMPIEQCLFYIEYAMDISSPSALYLGTYRLYKTTDDGRNWTMLNSCLFPTGTSCYYISAVSVAPYDGNLVFAGATGGHVGISQNAGANWTIISDSLPRAYCSSVRSFQPGTIYATYSRYGVDKVWRSTTMGASWESINGNLPDIPVNDIIELEGKLIIGSDLGAFISDDNGGTWQRFGTGMPAVSVRKLLFNQNTGTLRAVTHGRGMYDMQWKSLPVAAPVFQSLPDTSVLESGQPFTYAPVVVSNPPATFSLVEGPAEATIDPTLGVVRWRGGDKVGRFTIEASNTAGKAIQNFTLYTTDVVLADWRVVSPQRLSSNANTIRYAGNNVLWMSRDSAWVSRSTDGGASWEHSKIPNTFASVFGLHAFDKDKAVVGTRSGQIMKTTDGGQTWKEVLFGINARFGNIHFWDDLNGIAISQGELDSADVFLSGDGGETWMLVEPRQYARFPTDNTIHFFDRLNGWYASSNQGRTPPRDVSILRTTDGGLTWRVSDAGTRSVSGISFLTKNRGFLVDDVEGRVRRTANGGASWFTTFYPMNGLRTMSVYADPVSSVVWVMSDTSAWISTNEGSTWMRTQLVPVGTIQSAVFADSVNGWAVSKRGIVQTLEKNPLTSVARLRDALPLDIRLGAAYPNPVTSPLNATTIPFTISSHASVTLKIYNSAGKEVATLLDENLKPGEYFSTWDAAEAINGVYFYTLNVNSRKTTGRVVVMK